MPLLWKFLFVDHPREGFCFPCLTLELGWPDLLLLFSRRGFLLLWRPSCLFFLLTAGELFPFPVALLSLALDEVLGSTSGKQLAHSFSADRDRGGL